MGTRRSQLSQNNSQEIIFFDGNMLEAMNAKIQGAGGHMENMSLSSGGDNYKSRLVTKDQNALSSTHAHKAQLIGAGELAMTTQSLLDQKLDAKQNP
jgi:hypothetical protein